MTTLFFVPGCKLCALMAASVIDRAVIPADVRLAPGPDHCHALGIAHRGLDLFNRFISEWQVSKC